MCYNALMKRTVKKRDKGRHFRRFCVVVVAIALICTTFSASARVFDGRSGMSLFSEGVLWVVLGGKRNFSEEKTIGHIEKARKENENYRVPDFYKFLYGFSTYDFNGTEVCDYNPDGDKLIIYLHGGAYIYQPLLFHYRYCNVLARELDARVLMPIYPKAPNFTIEYMLDMVYDFYKDALKSYEPENIVFMGDSAGGGLSLSLAQTLLKSGDPQPSDIILLSPCVDIAFDNPELEAYAENDPMLCLPDLRLKMQYCTKKNTDMDDFRISPINGEVVGLAPITLFAGTYELLVPDARKFVKQSAEKGVIIDYYEYEKMCHTFCLFPIPEARECLIIIERAVYSR